MKILYISSCIYIKAKKKQVTKLFSNIHSEICTIAKNYEIEKEHKDDKKDEENQEKLDKN